MKIIKTLTKKRHVIITIQEERWFYIRFLKWMFVALYGITNSRACMVVAENLDKPTTYEVFAKFDNINDKHLYLHYLENGKKVNVKLANRIAMLANIYDEKNEIGMCS